MLCTTLSFDKQFAELNAGIFLISPFPGKCCGSQHLSNQQRNPEQRTSQLLKMSVSSEGQKKYIKKINKDVHLSFFGHIIGIERLFISG